MTTNFIISQGGVDKLVKPDGAWDLVELAKSEKKKLLWYPDEWHDLQNGPIWEEVMQLYVDMIPEYLEK